MTLLITEAAVRSLLDDVLIAGSRGGIFARTGR